MGYDKGRHRPSPPTKDFPPPYIPPRAPLFSGGTGQPPFKHPPSHPTYAQEAINYGSLEADTGLKWIDGRKIYRKSFNVGTLANTGSTSDAHHIRNLHHVINTSGFATDGTTSYSLPYASPTAADCIAIYVNATNIVITTGKDLTGLTGYVVLEYTKD